MDASSFNYPSTLFLLSVWLTAYFGFLYCVYLCPFGLLVSLSVCDSLSLFLCVCLFLCMLLCLVCLSFCLRLSLYQLQFYGQFGLDLKVLNCNYKYYKYILSLYFSPLAIWGMNFFLNLKSNCFTPRENLNDWEGQPACTYSSPLADTSIH